MWNRTLNISSVPISQGPQNDHTNYSRNGGYVYVTAGTGFVANAPARFITPVLQQASATCLIEFWVFTNGISSNQLNVTLLTGNQIERATLERLHYKSLSNWTKVTVEIGRVDVPFQIAMDSRRLSPTAWVAIDDTKILRCHLPPIVNSTSCQGVNQFLCARGSCVAKSRICDMTDDCGDHSDESSRLCASYQTCTFDVSFCDWRHDNTTEFKWELIKGPSPSDSTGVGNPLWLLHECSNVSHVLFSLIAIIRLDTPPVSMP